MLLAAALTLYFNLPFWGKDAPKWATDLGHAVTKITAEEWCRRQLVTGRPCVPKPDSAQFVASLDTLYHFVPEWKVSAAVDVDSFMRADSARKGKR